MASFLTHAALPLLAGRAVRLPPGVPPRRLVVAATLCATLADLDVLSFAFEVRVDELFGHRGLFHSLFAAGVLALVATAVGFRRAPSWGRVFGLLFLAAASHPLLDALTRGDAGVALFAPLSSERILFPLRPIPVCPLGVDEYLGRFGAIVLLNELLLVLVPAALAAEVARRARAGASLRPLQAAAAAWVLVAAGLWLRWPFLYAPTQERALASFGEFASDEDLLHIPREELPAPGLVTNFHALEARGLFGRKLEPERAPWSSGFFPAWYGGEAGRWKDSRTTLLARTLFGAATLSPQEARERLARSQGQGLAPTEKYDLAHADYEFAATRFALALTHNRRPRPRFWYGLCNGMTSAGITQPEPFRAVDVESPDGHVVRFHPLDVKALMGLAFYSLEETEVLGGNCEWITFDPGRTCSMNPGGLAIAALNYFGLARRAFAIDVHPGANVQNYPVAAARVDVVRGPYAPSTEPAEPGFRPRVAQLVDVDFALELSSTMLPVERADVPDAPDGTRFRKVGLVAVPFRWQATIVLDAQGEIIGGRWRGDPADGPDNISFPRGGPILDAGTMLDEYPKIDWSFVRALAKASAEEGQGAARLRTADLPR